MRHCLALHVTTLMDVDKLLDKSIRDAVLGYLAKLLSLWPLPHLLNARAEAGCCSGRSLVVAGEELHFVFVFKEVHVDLTFCLNKGS